jgi:hypothetical protein
MKKMMKKMMTDLQKRISIVNAYIKKQMSDLDFYNHFGYTEQKEIAIHNLDMSWEQIDMYKRQLRELKRDYKGSK